MRRSIAGSIIVLGLCVAVALSSPPKPGCYRDLGTVFGQLGPSGRPFRSEERDQFPPHASQIEEFIPPDRWRFGSMTPQGEVLSERIRVGQRRWLRDQRTWREEPIEQIPMQIERWPPIEQFECVGRLTFLGKTYIAYKAPLRSKGWGGWTLYPPGPGQLPTEEPTVEELKRMIEIERQFTEEMRRIRPDVVEAMERMDGSRKETKRWALIDPGSGLLAYDVMAEEGQLDNPKSRTHYTYPSNLVIEPPVR